MSATIGLDLGGTKLLGLCVSDDGAVLSRARRDTGRETSPARALSLVHELVEVLCAEAQVEVRAVGVGFPGLVDAPRGVVRSTVMIDGWRDVAFAAMVRDATGLPCAIDNDVNAAAVAELEVRKRAGEDIAAPDASMLLAAVGTGIGGAITVGGRLWRGRSGAAGELGNTSIDRHGATCWCARRGCLNTTASGTALERAWGLPTPLRDAWNAGDPRAREVVLEGARSLGYGIANAVQLLAPTLVALGGGVAEYGEAWRAEVEATVRAETFFEAMEHCRVELARAGYDAGALGAARLAQEAIS